MKRYALHGVAGLAKQSRNRLTGHLMSMYHAEQAEMSSDDTWLAVCEEHGAMVSAPTQALAQESMAYPEWCADCAGDLS